MSTNDELLERLDFSEHCGPSDGLPSMLDIMAKDCKDAAAAIRELEAKLEAERKAREITADRAAENFSAAVEAGDRAEAAEQRLREEVAHLSQYSDNQFLAKVEAMERATEAEVKLREVEAALWELVKLKDAKERVEELSARMMTGAEMAEIKRLNKYYKTDKEPAWEAARAALSPERTVEVDFDPCAPCCEPASPLLPGLERAAEICVQEIDDWGFGGQEAGRMAARKCANRCLAEISRLNGEGMGS